jgi:hypothetical protein
MFARVLLIAVVAGMKDEMSEITLNAKKLYK